MSSSSGGSSGTTVSVNDNPTSTSGPSSITRPQEPPPPTPTQSPPSATETDGAIAIGSGTEDGNKRSSTVLMIPAKSAEDEEDGAGSKKVGIDNPGFQDEESAPTTAVGNGGSVFIAVSPTATTPTNNGAAFLNSSATVDTSMLTEVNLNNSTISGGSDSIEKKNKKEVTEAVNLELVNMNPFSTNIETNGIPVKKEGGDDVVLGDSYNDPYDEYFVPVNEHRKYMRGEKLYVTKDKRRSQSWRRCICWGVGFVILSVAILIAILAGTGVILSQEEQPIINENSVSSRQFSGDRSNEPAAGGSLDRDGVSSFSPPPFISTVPPIPPTTELSQLYVPRALEGEFVIDNLEFNPELAISQSEEFHKLASALEEELKKALFDPAYLKYGATDIFVKVLEFSPGSVVVKFRVGWVLKKGITKVPDPIDIEHLRPRLERHLNRNNGYLDNYHIPLGSIRANHFIDMCQFNQCSHGCTFDYHNTMDFLCTCPPSMFLNPNGKNCTDNFMMEVEEPHFHETEEPYFHEPASPSPEPEPEPEPVATEETHVTTSTAAAVSSSTTTTTTTTTTTPATTTTTTSSYEELPPETSTPGPVIHSTETDYHILTPISSTTENLQYKNYDDEENEDYDINHFLIHTIAPPLQHEDASSTSSPVAEVESPTVGPHILEETHTVVVGLAENNVSKTEEPSHEVMATVQEDNDHDPALPNEVVQQGVMLATEAPLNTSTSSEENPIQYSILNHTESDNRENSVDTSANQPSILTSIEEEPVVLFGVTTTEHIMPTSSERAIETPMPPLSSDEQNSELFSNIDILNENKNVSSTEKINVEHVPLNYFENSAEEPTYVAHNIETEKEHNATYEDEINIPAEFAPTTIIPESINNESDNDAIVNEDEHFQSAVLGHSTEEVPTEESKIMISENPTLVHNERNHSVEGISFNELFSGSENDTILNALSPEDYENHPIDNVHSLEGNKTSINSTMPQKGFRLNDDEMFMPDPEDEDLPFKANQTSFLDEKTPSIVSSTTEEAHLVNEQEEIEQPSSNAAANTINDDTSLSKVNIAKNFTLENNDTQTKPEDMTKQKDNVFSMPEEITTEAIMNDGAVSKDDTNLGELWKQVVLDGTEDVHNDTETSSEHENITAMMPLLNMDENKDMSPNNETALPEVKVGGDIMGVTTISPAPEETTLSGTSGTSTVNSSVQTNATETSKENIIEVNELEHSNVISNNSSEEQPIIAPPTVHEYVNEARNFQDINDTHNAVEDNENVRKVLPIEEHSETTTVYSAVPDIVEHSDLLNQSKIMTNEDMPHHDDENITVLEATEGVPVMPKTTDNNEAEEQSTTLEPENDSEKIMQEITTSPELLNSMNLTQVTSSPTNDLYENVPENEVVDENSHNITNTDIIGSTTVDGAVAISSLDDMKNKTEVELDSKEKYENNNFTNLDNGTTADNSTSNSISMQKNSENATTILETPMETENEAEDEEDVFPGPLGINDFSGIQQFTQSTKPLQNNESYSFTEPTMLISSPKDDTEKSLTNNPLTEKSVDETHNSDIFKPIVPPEFSGEDLENKLLVEPGVIHDQSMSSTTEIPNEIHALPPSGGGNVIPPTSHSIPLTDTKLEDIHLPPVTEHLSNDTSDGNSSLTLPVVSAEMQGDSKEAEEMEQLTESVTKPETKKKDIQNISKKPVKPINDLGESDQSVPEKATAVLFDKKPTDKLQKFEKESSKKIDKMGLAALPVEDSMNESENESMMVTTEGTEEAEMDANISTNKTLESLPMSSISTTNNTSESVPMSSNSTTDNMSESLPMPSDNTTDDTSESLPMSLNSTADNMSESLPMPSNNAADNTSDTLPMPSNSTTDDTSDALSMPANSTIDNTSEDLPMPSNSTTDNTSESLPMPSNNTIDNISESLPMSSNSTMNNTSESLPMSSNGTMDNTSESLPMPSNGTMDNASESLPMPSNSTMDNASESLPMPSNSTIDNTSIVELADRMSPVMEENSSLFGTTENMKETSIKMMLEDENNMNSSSGTAFDSLFGENKEENQMENTSVGIPLNTAPKENENESASSNTSIPLMISITENSSEPNKNETSVQEDNMSLPIESTIDIHSFNVEPAISQLDNETNDSQKTLTDSEPQPNINDASIQNIVETGHETSSIPTESNTTISEMSTSMPSVENSTSNSSVDVPLISISDLVMPIENNLTNESSFVLSSSSTTPNSVAILDIASGLTTDAVNGSVSTNMSDDVMKSNVSENVTVKSVPNEGELPFPNIVVVNNEDFPGIDGKQEPSVEDINNAVNGSTLLEANNTLINNSYTTMPTAPAAEVRENLSNISEATMFFSKCPAGHFQCLNGTSHDGAYCVSLSSKCDSVNDCSDGSDEMGCMEEGCPGNFQCSSGQCLKRHLVCNGIVDCNDGSDEIHCDEWKCQFDEFQCPSGRCIPVLWQCDGKPDCDNHTDEYNCQVSCGNDEYLCPERWCIPMTWRCNGVAECANGEDEKLCDCSLDQFRCNTGGCVHKSQVCDGVEHCPDMSDEWECIRLNNDTMHLQIRSADSSWMSVCGDNWENELGNLACQNLGFSKAAFSVTAPSGSDDDSFFQLKPGTVASLLNGNRRLPALLEKSKNGSTCTSGTRVEMSCVEFTCGSHGLADAVAARLVGGDGATNGQWPSVALLYHTRQNSSCTASIISPKWLLSSYNCLHLRDKTLNAESWVAYGGGSMFETDKPERQMREVHAIIPYPQVKYNQFLYNNDIALIELDQPLLFTPNVGAICLPDKEIEQRQICVMAGWGYTSPGQINFSQYLNYLPVPTIDLQECNSTKHYTGIITDDEICAGYTDAEKSPCYNDEGAPLMCASEGGVWELQGVLSYHSNCGRGYHPSIFSSITSVRDWIEKTVGSHFERKSTFNVRRR